MSVYPFAGGRLELPASWTDQSVHVLAGPGAEPDGSGPAECSVVMHRDVLVGGEDLRGYAARQVADLAATLPECTVLAERTPLVGGLIAREVELRWMGDAELLRQRQLHFPVGGRVLTVTATAPERLWAKYAAAVQQVLLSLRFAPVLAAGAGDAGGPAGDAPGGPGA